MRAPEHPYDQSEDLLLPLTHADKAAFSRLFSMYYNRLLIFAHRFVPLDIAEDILSESFTKLWTRITDFDSLPAIEQWLRISTKNASIDHLRKQKAVAEREKNFIYLTDQQFEDLYFCSSVEADLLERIAVEIEQLPPLTGSILKLSFFEGLSVDEIAQKLEISRQVVYNRRSLGLKELRLYFSDKELALLWAIVVVIGWLRR